MHEPRWALPDFDQVGHHFISDLLKPFLDFVPTEDMLVERRWFVVLSH